MLALPSHLYAHYARILATYLADNDRKIGAVDAALQNKLFMAFEDTYLPPLKNEFTGYYGDTMLALLSHLYAHITRILATYLADNNRKLGET